MLEQELKNLSMMNKLRCPTCIVVNELCKPSNCDSECKDACCYNAVSVLDSAKIEQEKCNGCMECVKKCPLSAIDKKDLAYNQGQLYCDSCNNYYKIEDNLFYFYPKKFENKQFHDFYENFENRFDSWQEKVARNVKAKNILNVLGKETENIHSILDLGCSCGWILDELRENIFCEYSFGLDLSSSILSSIKGRQKENSYFIAGDCEYLPFSKNSFDLVISLDVIEHIANPEKFLKDISRISDNIVLKIPLENVFENFVWESFKKIVNFLNKGKNKDFHQHINFYSKKTAEKLLKDCDLEIVKSFIPDNPWSKEYNSFYFVNPALTIKNFRELKKMTKFRIMLKYYVIISFRKIVFLFLRPFYHFFCYTSFYVFCKTKKESKKK